MFQSCGSEHVRSRSAVLLATAYGASALQFACGGCDNGNVLDTSGADSPAQLSVQSDVAKAAAMIAGLIAPQGPASGGGSGSGSGKALSMTRVAQNTQCDSGSA